METIMAWHLDDDELELDKTRLNPKYFLTTFNYFSFDIFSFTLSLSPTFIYLNLLSVKKGTEKK